MDKKIVNYQQFLEGYKAGEIMVLVNKSKAGDLVMSDFASKQNKLAHQFWTWAGLVMLVPAPIVLLIIQGWAYAISAFVLGLVISKAARRSAEQFVLRNMIESEDFWDYVLMHGGAIMRDTQGNEVASAFLDRMANKVSNA